MSDNEEEYIYNTNQNDFFNNSNNLSSNNNHNPIKPEPLLYLKIENNISFYNQQKKLLQNLYKNLLIKDENIEKWKQNKELKINNIKKEIEKTYSIKSSTGKRMFEKKMKNLNNSILSLEKERNNILLEIKNTIDIKNISLLKNINSLQIKNNTISTIENLNKNVLIKIELLNNLITKINTVIKNPVLGKNTSEKEIISIIPILERLNVDLLTLNGLSSGLISNINLVKSNLKDKYKISKEYKELDKNVEKYTKLLKSNAVLIQETLEEAYMIRENYQIKLVNLVEELQKLNLYNSKNYNKAEIILKKLNEIIKYKFINSLDLKINNISIIDIIKNYNDLFYQIKLDEEF